MRVHDFGDLARISLIAQHSIHLKVEAATDPAIGDGGEENLGTWLKLAFPKTTDNDFVTLPR